MYSDNVQITNHNRSLREIKYREVRRINAKLANHVQNVQYFQIIIQ